MFVFLLILIYFLLFKKSVDITSIVKKKVMASIIRIKWLAKFENIAINSIALPPIIYVVNSILPHFETIHYLLYLFNMPKNKKKSE